jgi:hypothetical protein
MYLAARDLKKMEKEMGWVLNPLRIAGKQALWAAAVILLLAASGACLAGCAAGTKSERPGQYVDDATITGKVKGEILKDPELKVSQISVETYRGVVQLSGFVDSPKSVRRAGDIAAGVSGVVSVKNDLIVK